MRGRNLRRSLDYHHATCAPATEHGHCPLCTTRVQRLLCAHGAGCRKPNAPPGHHCTLRAGHVGSCQLRYAAGARLREWDGRTRSAWVDAGDGTEALFQSWQSPPAAATPWYLAVKVATRRKRVQLVLL